MEAPETGGWRSNSISMAVQSGSLTRTPIRASFAAGREVLAVELSKLGVKELKVAIKLCCTTAPRIRTQRGVALELQDLLGDAGVSFAPWTIAGQTPRFCLRCLGFLQFCNLRLVLQRRRTRDARFGLLGASDFGLLDCRTWSGPALIGVVCTRKSHSMLLRCFRRGS